MKKRMGILYIIISLIFCDINRSDTCIELDPCVGHRPKSDNGCCLGNQGSPCGVATGRSCDAELGFSCNEAIGLCQGKYNVTANDVGMTSLTLSWEDFKSQNYQYEYSILFTMIYTPDTAKWENVQVGIDSSVTLNNLHPDTLYFMRVGTWIDPYKGLYQVLTEVLMIHTKAAKFCLYNGKRIEVGEAFEIECEDHCVCQADGQLQCDPVCTSSEKGKLLDPLYDCNEYWAADPCCPVIDCHLIEADCKYQGEKIPNGHQWRIGCQETCKCFNGRVTCQPVCLEMQAPQNCDDPVLRHENESCCGHWECTDFNSTSSPVKLFQKALIWAENVTDTTAILRWIFTDSDIISKGDLTVKYRNNASNIWLPIQDVNFSSTWVNLLGLSPSTTYEVVIFFSPFHDTSTYSAGTTSFSTQKLKNKYLNLKVSLRILEISTTTVSIESRMPPRYRNHLDSIMKILWSATRSQNISSFVTNTSSSLHTISGLEPNTLYTIWLEVLLKNRAIINSTEVHFVTKDTNVISAGPPVFHQNFVIVVSVAVISVIVMALLVVAIIYLSRTRRKGSMHFSENAVDTRIAEINNKILHPGYNEFQTTIRNGANEQLLSMQMGKYDVFESHDVSIIDENMPSRIKDL